MLARLIITLLLVGGALAARADDYDSLRLKWRDVIVGTGYNTADADVAARLVDIANAANSPWASMDKTVARTFLWSDAASTTVAADLTTNFSRLRAMALAYATPGCALQGNAALLADITGGLEWMNANRYNPTKAIYENWWDWEIGAPLQLVDIAVLLYDQLTATQLANAMAAVEKFTPSATTQAPGGTTGTFTGANRMWKIRVVAVRGAVVKNSAKLVAARDAISVLFEYATAGDGFHADGSFIQHSVQPYTAGYGAALVNTIVPVMAWLAGSTWAVIDPTQSHLFQWVYDSYEPIIYRGAAMDFVRGREISRSSASPQGTGHGIMDSIIQMAQFAPASDAARMKCMVKYWAQSDTVRNFVTARPLPTLTLAKQLMADAGVAPRGELRGHFNFAKMDRVMHLGAGFGFGLSLCSTRIANFESINGENLHGWFTANGMTTLYNADLNQYGDAYWPTVDAYRLPGVTADPTHNKLPATPNTIGPRAQGQATLTAYPWAGGATLGNYGAAGMQLDGWGVTLTANKSWFMFDDEVVCLGAGITSTDGRPIETTVENRKLNAAGSNALTVNGAAKSTALGWSETLNSVNWAHLAGSASGADIGYYFPQAATLTAVREARTGAWADIDDGASATAITRNYVRLGIGHGSNPSNATYQYVLLPGFNATRVSHYATQPQIHVLANTPDVQAVTETTLGITAANFWTDTAQTAGLITANKKCSVLVRADGPFMDVSISDPTQSNTGSISLQLAASGGTFISADSGITVTQVTPGIAMTVNVSGAQGKTFKARFYTGTPQIVNVAPEADAYVYDGGTTANYGTDASLIVKKSGTGYNRESYLRFNVPAWNGVLVGASLQLMPTTVQTPGVHGVAAVTDNSWLEAGTSGITWTTKPASSATVLATWTPALSTPVSASVLGAITTSGLKSLRVYSTNQTTDGFVSYASREAASAANRPQLALALAQTPPEISITSPADGEVITHGGSLTITADAQPTDGVVASVVFYDGATALGSDSTAPYAITASLNGGIHRLTAVATASNGLSRTSLSRRIDVAYPPTASATAVSTPLGTAIDVDLLTLASDVETAPNKLRFTLGSAANGTVALLADGHTARFTPGAGYRGPASFGYSVTDATGDDRLLLNYDFQTSTAADTSGQGREGFINIQGTGAAGYTADFPAVLAPQHTQSVRLTENGSAGAARIESTLSSGDVDLKNADWTVSGWFKRATATNQDSVFHLGDSGGFGSNALTLAFYGTSSTIELANYNGSTKDVSITKTNVTTAAWHHFAIVRGGATLSLYLDATLTGSDTAFGCAFDNSKPVKFGGVTTSVTDRWFQGSFADLAVFAGALTAGEITQLASLPTANFAGLVTGSTVNVNVTVSAAENADTDGDGLTDVQEYVFGSNPALPEAGSLLTPAAAGNGLTLSFVARQAAGLGYAGLTRYYSVETTTDLADPTAWTPLAGYSNLVGANQTVAITPPTGARRCFYRLRVSLQ